MPSPDEQIAKAVESKLRESARGLSDIQRLNKLLAINKLALRGMKTSAIAAHPEVNLPDSTVVSMLRSLKAEWKERVQESVLELKAAELAKIDHIEEEAWAAWERSKEAKRRDQVNAEIDMRDGQAKRTPRVSRTVQEDRVGDPRFLDVIFRCIDRRIELFGLVSEDTRTDPALVGGVSEVATLDLRISKYIAAGVFHDGIIAAPGTAAGLDGAGEPVDSERSAPEAGAVLDLDESQWRPAP